MTLSDINTVISELTNSDTNDFANSSRVIYLNNWYDLVHASILQSMDEVDFDDSNDTDYPVMTTNLVANQQDYPLKAGTLSVKRAEITYDGTNWYKLSPFDVGETDLATNSTSITNNFQTNQPFYDIEANSVFLYPVPTQNVTNGLKMWVNRNVTPFVTADLTGGTKTPGFDRNFHMILAKGVAYDYALKQGNENRNQLKQDIAELMAGLRSHYGKKQDDRQMNMRADLPSYL